MSVVQSMSDLELQRAYYASTVAQYEALHFGQDPEHDFALAWLSGVVSFLQAEELLDVGAGTGRVLHYMKRTHPGLRVVGIEPIAELRRVGYGNGLTEQELIAGDGGQVPYADGAFDIVCAFAVLHHVRHPECVVSEMLRVAKKAVFISDSNNFGQGSWLVRSVKQMLRVLHLWKLADRIKTHGRGYSISKEDGLSYSYSVFDSLPLVRSSCRSVHFMNTRDSGPSLFRTAGYAALLGLK
ncbi:MAG: class I SAM-dependent methyltransferase [Acidobacteria bacterium]|nr:class I SAM-dependent methyltransferase [Acidobacteriota bacterium]